MLNHVYIHYKIMKMEMEDNGMFPFLGTHEEPLNSTHVQTKVYVKPTNTSLFSHIITVILMININAAN